MSFRDPVLTLREQIRSLETHVASLQQSTPWLLRATAAPEVAAQLAQVAAQLAKTRDDDPASLTARRALLERSAALHLHRLQDVHRAHAVIQAVATWTPEIRYPYHRRSADALGLHSALPYLSDDIELRRSTADLVAHLQRRDARMQHTFTRGYLQATLAVRDVGMAVTVVQGDPAVLDRRAAWLTVAAHVPLLVPDIAVTPRRALTAIAVALRLAQDRKTGDPVLDARFRIAAPLDAMSLFTPRVRDALLRVRDHLDHERLLVAGGIARVDAAGDMTPAAFEAAVEPLLAMRDATVDLGPR